MDKDRLKEIYDNLYDLNIEAINADEVPVSACLIYKDKEYYTSNSMNKNDDILDHAEIKAIQRVLKENKDVKYLDDSTLIVTLEPCLMCMGAILKSHISKLIYIVEDEKEGSISYYHTFTRDKLECVLIRDDRFIRQLSSFFKEKRL